MEMRLAYTECHNCAGREEAAEKCALRLAAELSLAIHERGRAVMAVSVSADTQLLFAVLSQTDIPWSFVTLALIDECYVPVTAPQSRERALRAGLLQNRAAAARFVGLYNEARTAELAAFSASARINRLSRPFDCAVLDMDIQGQTAGFFKGSSRLQAALNREGRALVLPNYVKFSGETHLTMTLPLLAEAGLIVLPLNGREKLSVLEEAEQEGAAKDMPVRALLRAARQPVQVFFSL
ncbi:MAG: 6-phosphogluconolactonase [Candidatus Tokpelaia sp.]|nr:MAG: 6-phosphogluconolactonase [Candidatus Tokpelaia sp.]KAA6206292.1 MAG: 6-phosphogluconolactonase [Candidatus Tokpelaia sp.]